MSQAFGRMVRFLLVTAQRRDEAASLRHGDIVRGVWKQTDNKSNRPHTLALPSLALNLVGQGESQALVFAGGNGKISGFSKLKRALDKASGVSGWRLHESAPLGCLAHAGARHRARYHPGHPQSRDAGRRRRLHARRT